MNIGLVKETKIKEKRIALIPQDVKKLVEAGHQVFVEKDAGLGCGFTDEMYEKSGATISVEVDRQPLVVRVKKPPLDKLVPGQTMMGYLHIEKGQNPTLLKALLERNITAYAFEEIRDSQGIRLVSLGFEAGIVGMFEGLRTYGQLLEKQNLESPFRNLKPIWEYQNKEQIYQELRKIDPGDFTAQVCIVGYGNVSKGAQEVLAQLNHPPLVLKEEDTVREENYARIWQHLPNIDILVNAVAWLPGQDRILTKEDLERMKKNSLIVDISCDREGGIETCRPTTWDHPTYVVKDVVHFCVDNLPSAMAYDSSVHLSKMILPFVLKVANGEELESGLMTKDGKIKFRN